MTNQLFLPYIPQTAELPVIPLTRYLPPAPPGMLETWLRDNVPVDSWVVDPFGSTPLTALQAARAGYRVLAAINNPLLAFCLKQLSQPASAAEFQSALAELASSRRGDQRIETQIQELYLTRCATCGKEIQATGYLWRRGENTPYARLYTCPGCGDEGVHPITESDITRLTSLQRAEPLHRARAIEKVLAAEADQDLRQNIQEAVQIYPVRPLVVLFTLLNKLESLLITENKKKALQALILTCFDAGTSLWPWPLSKDSPRQLITPPEFLERNLWLELEKSIDLWSKPAQPVECVEWPQLPAKAGICIFPGRIKSLANLTQVLTPKAVLCVFPRPNQPFWTLSALWSAWIWGKETAAHYVNVLSRRRFDWLWHARALQAALNATAEAVPPETPFFGIVPEALPGLVLSTNVAIAAAGLVPQGMSCKSDDQVVQYLWKKRASPGSSKGVNVQNIAREAIRESLRTLGQPSSYLAPYSTALLQLSNEDALPLTGEQITAESFSECQTLIQRLFYEKSFLVHYDSTAQEIDYGSWGLVETTSNQEPLDDRVENECLHLLLENRSLTVSEARVHLHKKLPGILTPPDALLQLCLSAYCEMDTPINRWHLKQGEKIAEREEEQRSISEMILNLGKRLGFCVREDGHLFWDSKGGISYLFTISSNASLARFPDYSTDDQTHFVLVFPGSRSALLKYKLDHNPELRARVTANWHFLKYRYLREISQRERLTADEFGFLLDGDPISPEKAIQLRIF